MAEYKTLVKKIPISPDKKTKQKDYLKKGQLPIVDQGQSLVGGYTDDANMTVECELPVIVFGDHTRAVKYITFPFGAGADGIKVLQPKENILPPFLYYGTQYIVAKMPNRGYARHYQYVEKEDLPVPSLPEQERIVARIEELFSQLDAGVETLKKTKAEIVLYRQAVFSSVIGKYDGVSKKLSDIAVTVDGDRGKKYPKKAELTQTGDCLFLTAANVKPYGWSFEDNTFISKEKDSILHGGRLQKNDVVITTRGTLGNVAIYDESVPFDTVRINSCMLIIRVTDESVSPYYLAQDLMSPMFKYQIAKLKSGTAQPQIPANILSEIPLKIPSSNDQNAIIGELTGKFSVCDSIEQTVDTALQQAEAMRQSILKDAFEGKL